LELHGSELKFSDQREPWSGEGLEEIGYVMNFRREF